MPTAAEADESTADGELTINDRDLPQATSQNVTGKPHCYNQLSIYLPLIVSVSTEPQARLCATADWSWEGDIDNCT